MSAACCPYCQGSFARLSRHLDTCRVRRDELSREERNAAVTLAAARTPATVNVANFVDARTLNVTIIATQQVCARHDELFTGYAQRLMAGSARDPAPWRAGLDAARARIREIAAAAASVSPDDQATTRLLRGEEISIECGAEADGDKVVEHALERVGTIGRRLTRSGVTPDAVRTALEASKSLFDV